MLKMWLVAKREYLYNLKRRSFLFAAFGIPLFIVVVMLIVSVFTANSSGDLASVGKVGYLDLSGVLSQAVDKPDSFVAYNTEEEASHALQDKTLGAYFVLPKDYMNNGQVRLYNFSTSPDALKSAINDFLLANLSAGRTGLLSRERVKHPVTLTVHLEDSGRTVQEGAILGLFFAPLIFTVVFMMASQITSGFLMGGVVEEKTNRIMEVLMTSITPLQLLAGKLIGLGVLGLTQLAVWGVVAAIVLRFGNTIPFLSAVVLPADLLVVAVIYFLLGYFFLAGIMAGIGAVAGSEEESRQYSGIFSIVLAIPFFAIVTFIQDPNGTLPVVLSLIPFTAPLSMILRMSFGVVPLPQILLSVAVMIASTSLVVWLSARVFRWGLLMYGKRFTPRQLWQVIRQSSKPESGITRPSQEVVS